MIRYMIINPDRTYRVVETEESFEAFAAQLDCSFIEAVPTDPTLVPEELEEFSCSFEILGDGEGFAIKGAKVPNSAAGDLTFGSHQYGIMGAIAVFANSMGDEVMHSITDDLVAQIVEFANLSSEKK